jgi:formiminotetrahydrofolate cyclodeaminase
MLEATRVPLRTAAVAGDVVRLAGRIAEGANVTALADLAAAAVSARAAVEVVRLNVEANLVAIADPSHRKAFADRMTDLSGLVAEAERIVADIRTRIQG